MTSLRLERWITRKFRLRHVELIAQAYDSRSILKAARRLNLTQPTVTKALQDVESTLGLKLFERTNRGIEPTEYGEIFARHAKVVLAQLRHAAEELEAAEPVLSRLGVRSAEVLRAGQGRVVSATTIVRVVMGGRGREERAGAQRSRRGVA